MKQVLAIAVVAIGSLASSSTKVIPAVHELVASHSESRRHPPLILPGLTVDARSANPGAEGFSRPECVAFGLGPASRYECGDLQVRHLLPTTREYNRNRTPMLIYNSTTARPRPIVGAYVSTPTSTTADSITASLTVNGTTVATTQFAGSAWSTGGVTRRIALGFDATSYATAVYPYTLTITAKISGQYYATSDTGSLVVVNRSQSKYGAGWWLASHERFYIQADGSFLWVGGDGSWLRYTGSGVLGTRVASGATRPDSIVDHGTSYSGQPMWARSLPNGGMVWYDLNGQLVNTAGLGWYGSLVTSYTINANGAVTRISLPPTSADSVLRYDLSYDGNGNLSQITSPGLTAAQNPKRRTLVTVATDGRLTQIVDPDSLATKFVYSGSTALMVGRADKLSDTLSFSYDSAQKISQLSRPLNSTQTAVTTFCAAEIQGLVGVNCSAGPTDTVAVSTRLDGPRDSTDVLDKTKIWITRAGAPRKLVDPLSDTTIITYADGRFLGLPTKLQYPDGRTVQTWYNSRALPDSMKDFSNCISGTCATSRFVWDSAWAMPTKVVRPAGDSVMYAYDSFANRLWQQDGSGSSGRTTFGYQYGTSLVTSVRHPSGSGSTGVGVDSIVYDVFGNVDTTFTPEGRTRTFLYSLAGGLARSQFAGVADTTIFDAMNRPIRTRTGPPYAGHDSVVVRQIYDAEGNVVALIRRGSRVTDSLLTRSTYDKANRKVTDISADGLVDSVFYDKASNIITTKSRRGLTISSAYDAMNRLTTRIIPSVTYDSAKRGIAALQPSGGDTANTAYPRYPNASGWKYTIPTDTLRFTYDVASRLLTAKNRASRVTRTYATSGKLASERQQVMTWAGTGADSNYTAHDYTLQYSYDLDGRRISVQHPAQLLPRDAGRTIGSTTGYSYDSKTSNLSTVTDVFGQTHRYFYSNRGDIDSVFHSAVYGGSAHPQTELWQQSLDGLPTSVSVGSPSGSVVVASTLSYDAAGRLQSSVETGGRNGTYYYSELGPIYRSMMAGSTAGIGSWWSCESFTMDALGNTTAAGTSLTIGGSCSTPTDSVTYKYSSTSGRLDRLRQPASVLRHSYDNAGNLEFQYTDSLPNNTSYTDARDRYSYYAADGHISASDARWAAVRLGYSTHPYDSLQTVFEEYRYDALGRRVAVRSRKYCASGMGSMCTIGTIRRTVWDGDQELHEITMPGDNGVTVAELENDTLPVTRTFPHVLVAGVPADQQDALNLFGRVMYVFGRSMDSPIALIRSNFVGSWVAYTASWEAAWVFQPRTVLPVYDWRGSFVSAYFAENGQSNWSVVDTTISQWRVMPVPLSGTETAFGGLQSTTASLFGTLLGGKQDDAGTFYRRNRAYDPATGRFTQEDPIGFGGGINLYAYAGGDPINFNDPYGLKTTQDVVDDCRGLDGFDYWNCWWAVAWRSFGGSNGGEWSLFDPATWGGRGGGACVGVLATVGAMAGIWSPSADAHCSYLQAQFPNTDPLALQGFASAYWGGGGSGLQVCMNISDGLWSLNYSGNGASAGTISIAFGPSLSLKRILDVWSTVLGLTPKPCGTIAGGS